MKYYLSLCCIIKNERYLEEFIIYYNILGVEHFYIYDNESSYPIKDRLNSFFYKKICTIIDFSGKNMQMPAYNHFLKNYGPQTKWCIICDGDEYILPKKNYWSLRDFLNEYDDSHAIGINWVMFGTSNHNNIQNGYLTDKYRHCCKNQNNHIKTICKPKFVQSCNHPHFVVLYDPSKYIDCKRNIISGPFNENYTIDTIQINHYHERSVEEIIEKYNRGNADSDRRISTIIQEENNEIIDNYLTEKYLNHIIRIHKITGINWEIYRALNKDLEKMLITEDDYYNHIIHNSHIENRHCHITDRFPNFSKEEFRKTDPNLNNFTDLNLEIHYIKYH